MDNITIFVQNTRKSIRHVSATAGVCLVQANHGRSNTNRNSQHWKAGGIYRMSLVKHRRLACSETALCELRCICFTSMSYLLLHTWSSCSCDIAIPLMKSSNIRLHSHTTHIAFDLHRPKLCTRLVKKEKARPAWASLGSDLLRWHLPPDAFDCVSQSSLAVPPLYATLCLFAICMGPTQAPTLPNRFGIPPRTRSVPKYHKMQRNINEIMLLHGVFVITRDTWSETALL